MGPSTQVLKASLINVSLAGASLLPIITLDTHSNKALEP